MLLADLDPARVKQVRKDLPFLQDRAPWRTTVELVCAGAPT